MAKKGMRRDTRAQTAPTAPATGRVRSLLTFIFRLLLLGVSSSGAWLAGVAVAKFYYPAQSPEPPLQEIVLRRSSHLIRQIQRLPDRWNQSSPSPQTPDPSSSSPGSAPPSQTVASNPNPPRSLTAAEQQQVKQTLTRLATDLQDLSDRTTALETQLGQTASNSPVESRLQSLNQQLSSQTDSTTAGNAANPAADPSLNPSSWTVDSSPNTGPTLKVTLPSDLLFEDNQEQLKAEASRILDRIIPDLAKYPSATILIGCHTDNQSEFDISRELTFQQAIAIERRLAQTLGQTHHLVPVGYGQTQPLASNNTVIDRQRNRRIEITIAPR